MNLRQIIVLKNKGHWAVRSQSVGKERVFETKQQALKAAVDMANQSGKDGEPARVMICDIKHASAQAFWTYGEDAYPPIIEKDEVPVS